jgi:CRISPR-associated protein Cmr4
MNTQLMGLLAETFIHVGGGQSEGVVDLPVAREAATDYPFIPGSGLKGALLDWAIQHEEVDKDRRECLFGKPDKAGQLLFADARLLALPVRSLHGASRWITCPHLWERYQRDATRLGRDVPALDSVPEPGQALGKDENRVILEERSFELAGTIPEFITAALGALITPEATRQRLDKSLLLLHDDDFTWFARYGLAVQARNSLDPEKKTTLLGALWYEESLPPDSLFYTLISERNQDTLQALLEPLRANPYLQVGGNETIGQGWLALTFPQMQS